MRQNSEWTKPYFICHVVVDTERQVVVIIFNFSIELEIKRDIQGLLRCSSCRNCLIRPRNPHITGAYQL